ncbi:MAG: metallopeptidase TldD-related protein [Terracidiphilus sp.]|jgi:predicted Zn-dependent protease
MPKFRCKFQILSLAMCFSLLPHCFTAAAQSAPASTSASPLLDAMTAELSRAMTSLSKAVQPNQQPPYYIGYDAHDATRLNIVAQQGAILSSEENRQRTADITVRVGDWKVDNTHGLHRTSALHSIELPLGDNRAAIARTLWWGTNACYGNALQSYLKVKSELAVQAKEEDTSPDFSRQDAVHAQLAPVAPPPLDRKAWEERIRALSFIFRAHLQININMVALTVSSVNNYFVSSEGSRLVYPHQLIRIVVVAGTRADDGMDISLARTFESRTERDLPAQAEFERQIQILAGQLDALRTAPTAEPYNGPALLSGRASAVFFHEVLGHRLEGQRQRGNQEGETFTKDVGKPILPAFLSVADDPTMASFDGTYLNGSYTYDEEGQPAQRVELVQKGVLQQFLMSRMPIANFDTSNGHGRAQMGRMPTGRQGNLIVTSSKAMPEKKLRQLLIEEIKKQNKPYGLYFEDIASGYTLTQRYTPQAFQVIPQLVYRVYADGRPDELVRGVQIVGTPQAALKQILATGDKPGVFNGECGAESGSVPVSAIAPAMLFSGIETQKAPQGKARPPILPSPTAENATEVQ